MDYESDLILSPLEVWKKDLEEEEILHCGADCGYELISSETGKSDSSHCGQGVKKTPEKVKNSRKNGRNECAENQIDSAGGGAPVSVQEAEKSSSLRALDVEKSSGEVKSLRKNRRKCTHNQNTVASPCTTSSVQEQARTKSKLIDSKGDGSSRRLNHLKQKRNKSSTTRRLALNESFEESDYASKIETSAPFSKGGDGVDGHQLSVIKKNKTKLKKQRILDSESSSDEISECEVERSFGQQKKREVGKKRFTLARRRNYVYAPIIFADHYSRREKSAKVLDKMNESADEKDVKTSTSSDRSTKYTTETRKDDTNIYSNVSKKRKKDKRMLFNNTEYGTRHEIAKSTKNTHNNNETNADIPDEDHVEYPEHSSSDYTPEKQQGCSKQDHELSPKCLEVAMDDSSPALNGPVLEYSDNAESCHSEHQNRLIVETLERTGILGQAKLSNTSSTGTGSAVPPGSPRPAQSLKTISALSDIFLCENVVSKPPPVKRKPPEPESPVAEHQLSHEVTLLDDDSLWSSR